MHTTSCPIPRSANSTTNMEKKVLNKAAVVVAAWRPRIFSRNFLAEAVAAASAACLVAEVA